MNANGKKWKGKNGKWNRLKINVIGIEWKLKERKRKKYENGKVRKRKKNEKEKRKRMKMEKNEKEKRKWMKMENNENEKKETYENGKEWK